MFESWPMVYWLVTILGLIAVTHSQVQREYEFEVTRHHTKIPWLTCPQGWIQFGTDCYKVFLEPVTFSEAETICRSFGGHLVYIDGLSKNRAIGQAVLDLSTTAGPFWIGLQKGHLDILQWTNSHKSEWYDGIWKIGQRKVTQPDLDLCVSVETNSTVANGNDLFRWSLDSCEQQLVFVCEIVSCRAEDFRCSDGKCIPEKAKCDGQSDCSDGSDELGCAEDTTVGCGGELSGTQHAFQSPRAPGGEYSPFAHCQWRIVAPTRHKIKLQFTEFVTELHYDTVTVIDGPSTSDPTLATFSGHQIPPDIDSTTNFLLVIFKTDHTVQYSGFKANWTSVSFSCSETLGATHGTTVVTSPKYPAHYPGNLKCNWLIHADGQIISIQVLDVDLASGDWLKIHDGDSGEATLIAHYLGSSRGDLLFTTGPTVFIHFNSDLIDAGRGFNITYQAGCDVTLTSGYGRISSPGYTTGNQYPTNLNCTVSLPYTNKGERTLIIEEFDTEERFDVLEVFNGSRSESSLLTNLSGHVGSVMYLSSRSGYFLLHFRTDSHVGRKGWTASYSYGCSNVSPMAAHMHVISSNVSYGSLANYDCDTGYQILGTSNRYCDMGGEWRTPQPNMCTIIYCGAPEVLKGGALQNMTSRYYRGVAYYMCNPGYKLVGSPRVECKNDGWTEFPECIPTECPKLAPLLHGRTFTPYHNFILQRVNFSCNAGYRLVGYTFAECQSVGSWSNNITDHMPVCLPENETVCAEIRLAHGRASKVGPLHPNDTVKITCNPGYMRNGTRQLTCLDTGSYDGPLPNCTDIDECEDMPCGNHTCNNTEGSFWCTCLPGYHHPNSSDHKCVDIPECSMKDKGGCDHVCIELPGSYSCACNAGFRLYTENYTQSVGTKVLVPGVSCYILCPNVSIVYASRLYYTTDPLPDGSLIQGTSLYVECDNRTLLTGPADNATCNSTGHWAPSLPKCLVAQCPKVSNIANGVVTYSSQRMLDSYVHFSCNQGHYLYGNEHLYCAKVMRSGNITAEWTGPKPVCKPFDCGFPPKLKDGSISNAMTTYNSVETYSCNRGFKLVGNNTRTCQSSGFWSTEVILCVAETCSNPVLSEYVTMVTQPQIYTNETSLQFTCGREGYKITNPYPVVCQPPGFPTDNNPRMVAPETHITVSFTLNLTTAEIENCVTHYNQQFRQSLKNTTDGKTFKCPTSAVVYTLSVTVTWVDYRNQEVKLSQTLVAVRTNKNQPTAVPVSCLNSMVQTLVPPNMTLHANTDCAQKLGSDGLLSFSHAEEVCPNGVLREINRFKTCVIIKEASNTAVLDHSSLTPNLAPSPTSTTLQESTKLSQESPYLSSPISVELLLSKTSAIPLNIPTTLSIFNALNITKVTSYKLTSQINVTSTEETNTQQTTMTVKLADSKEITRSRNTLLRSSDKTNDVLKTSKSTEFNVDQSINSHFASAPLAVISPTVLHVLNASHDKLELSSSRNSGYAASMLNSETAIHSSTASSSTISLTDTFSVKEGSPFTSLFNIPHTSSTSQSIRTPLHVVEAVSTHTTFQRVSSVPSAPSSQEHYLKSLDSNLIISPTPVYSPNPRETSISRMNKVEIYDNISAESSLAGDLDDHKIRPSFNPFSDHNLQTLPISHSHLSYLMHMASPSQATLNDLNEVTNERESSLSNPISLFTTPYLQTISQAINLTISDSDGLSSDATIPTLFPSSSNISVNIHDISSSSLLSRSSPTNKTFNMQTPKQTNTVMNTNSIRQLEPVENLVKDSEVHQTTSLFSIFEPSQASSMLDVDSLSNLHDVDPSSLSNLIKADTSTLKELFVSQSYFGNTLFQSLVDKSTLSFVFLRQVMSSHMNENDHYMSSSMQLQSSLPEQSIFERTTSIAEKPPFLSDTVSLTSDPISYSYTNTNGSRSVIITPSVSASFVEDPVDQYAEQRTGPVSMSETGHRPMAIPKFIHVKVIAQKPSLSSLFDNTVEHSISTDYTSVVSTPKNSIYNFSYVDNAVSSDVPDVSSHSLLNILPSWTPSYRFSDVTFHTDPKSSEQLIISKASKALASSPIFSGTLKPIVKAMLDTSVLDLPSMPLSSLINSDSPYRQLHKALVDTSEMSSLFMSSIPGTYLTFNEKPIYHKMSDFLKAKTSSLQLIDPSLIHPTPASIFGSVSLTSSSLVPLTLEDKFTEPLNVIRPHTFNFSVDQQANISNKNNPEVSIPSYSDKKGATVFEESSHLGQKTRSNAEQSKINSQTYSNDLSISDVQVLNSISTTQQKGSISIAPSSTLQPSFHLYFNSFKNSSLSSGVFSHPYVTMSSASMVSSRVSEFTASIFASSVHPVTNMFREQVFTSRNGHSEAYSEYSAHETETMKNTGFKNKHSDLESQYEWNSRIEGNNVEIEGSKYISTQAPASVTVKGIVSTEMLVNTTKAVSPVLQKMEDVKMTTKTPTWKIQTFWEVPSFHSKKQQAVHRSSTDSTRSKFTVKDNLVKNTSEKNPTWLTSVAAKNHLNNLKIRTETIGISAYRKPKKGNVTEHMSSRGVTSPNIWESTSTPAASNSVPTLLQHVEETVASTSNISLDTDDSSLVTSTRAKKNWDATRSRMRKKSLSEVVNPSGTNRSESSENVRESKDLYSSFMDAPVGCVCIHRDREFTAGESSLLPGPVALLLVNFSLSLGSEYLSEVCMGGLHTLVQSKVQGIVDSLDLQQHCPQASNIVLANTSGSITTENSQAMVHVPFFLYDHTAIYSHVQGCAWDLRAIFLSAFTDALQNIAIYTDIEACPSVALETESLQVPDMVTLCQEGFIFHSLAGECMYCGDCSVLNESTTVFPTIETTFVQSSTTAPSVSSTYSTTIQTTTVSETSEITSSESTSVDTTSSQTSVSSTITVSTPAPSTSSSTVKSTLFSSTRDQTSSTTESSSSTTNALTSTTRRPPRTTSNPTTDTSSSTTDDGRATSTAFTPSDRTSQTTSNISITTTQTTQETSSATLTAVDTTNTQSTKPPQTTTTTSSLTTSTGQQTSIQTTTQETTDDQTSTSVTTFRPPRTTESPVTSTVEINTTNAVSFTTITTAEHTDSTTTIAATTARPPRTREPSTTTSSTVTTAPPPTTVTPTEGSTTAATTARPPRTREPSTTTSSTVTTAPTTVTPTEGLTTAASTPRPPRTREPSTTTSPTVTTAPPTTTVTPTEGSTTAATTARPPRTREPSTTTSPAETTAPPPTTVTPTEGLTTAATTARPPRTREPSTTTSPAVTTAPPTTTVTPTEGLTTAVTTARPPRTQEPSTTTSPAVTTAPPTTTVTPTEGLTTATTTARPPRTREPSTTTSPAETTAPPTTTVTPTEGLTTAASSLRPPRTREPSTTTSPTVTTAPPTTTVTPTEGLTTAATTLRPPRTREPSTTTSPTVTTAPPPSTVATTEGLTTTTATTLRPPRTRVPSTTTSSTVPPPTTLTPTEDLTTTAATTARPTRTREPSTTTSSTVTTIPTTTTLTPTEDLTTTAATTARPPRTREPSTTTSSTVTTIPPTTTVTPTEGLTTTAATTLRPPRTREPSTSTSSTVPPTTTLTPTEDLTTAATTARPPRTREPSTTTSSTVTTAPPPTTVATTEGLTTTAATTLRPPRTREPSTSTSSTVPPTTTLTPTEDLTTAATTARPPRTREPSTTTSSTVTTAPPPTTVATTEGLTTTAATTLRPPRTREPSTATSSTVTTAPPPTTVTPTEELTTTAATTARPPRTREPSTTTTGTSNSVFSTSASFSTTPNAPTTTRLGSTEGPTTTTSTPRPPRTREPTITTIETTSLASTTNNTPTATLTPSSLPSTTVATTGNSTTTAAISTARPPRTREPSTVTMATTTLSPATSEATSTIFTTTTNTPATTTTDSTTSEADFTTTPLITTSAFLEASTTVDKTMSTTTSLFATTTVPAETETPDTTEGSTTRWNYSVDYSTSTTSSASTSGMSSTISALTSSTTASDSTTTTSIPSSITHTPSASTTASSPESTTSSTTTTAEIPRSSSMTPAVSTTVSDTTEASTSTTSISSTTTTATSTAASTTATVTTTSTRPPNTTPRYDYSMCASVPQDSDLRPVLELDYYKEHLSIFMKLHLLTATTSSYCLSGYNAALNILMEDRERQINSHADLNRWCWEQGIYLKVETDVVQIIQNVEVTIKLIVTLAPVVGSSILVEQMGNCVEKVSKFVDILEAVCLFRTPLVNAQGTGADCDRLNLDRKVFLSYNLKRVCSDGWVSAGNYRCEPAASQSLQSDAPQDGAPVHTADTSISPPVTMETSTKTITKVTDSLVSDLYGVHHSQKSGAGTTSTSQRMSTVKEAMACYTCTSTSDVNECERTSELCPSQDEVCFIQIRLVSTKVWYEKGCIPRSKCEKLVPHCGTGNQNCVFKCCGERNCNRDTAVDLSASVSRKKRDVSTDNQAALVEWNSTMPKCIDTESPVFTNCPAEDFTLTSSDGRPVMLDFPVPSATDNSGMKPVISTTQENLQLPFNVSQAGQLRFVATDAMGNTAKCIVNIKFTDLSAGSVCPALTEPINGYFNCVDIGTNKVCTPMCHREYTFVENIAANYSCDTRDTGQWFPAVTPLECVSLEHRQCPKWTYNVSWNVMPDSVLPSDRSTCNFQSAVSQMVHDRLALYNVLVNVTDNYAKFEQNGQILLGVVFVVHGGPPTNCTDLVSIKDVLGSSFMTISCSNNATYMNTSLNDMTIAQSSKACTEGLVFRRNDGQMDTHCWPCPSGMEASTVTCSLCRSGYYREDLSTMSCQICPPSTGTLNQGSKYQQDCLRKCQAGNFSTTGLVPCFQCPKNQYQETIGQTFCHKCPDSKCTTGRGAANITDCKSSFCDTPCTSNPCTNGATCRVNEDSYQCVCTEGYTGTRCELVIDPCQNVNCNYGNCLSIHGNQTAACICYEGFTGNSCDVPIRHCHTDNPCGNGKCIDIAGGYICNCTGTGYYGDSCNRSLDLCGSVHCANNGTCVVSQTDRSVKCQCPNDSTGQYCEHVRSACDSMSCHNGGTCLLNDARDPVCVCKNDYSGTQCETSPMCDPAQCNNRGTCLLKSNGITCICEKGFDGEHCEVDLFHSLCDLDPCHYNNSVECFNEADTYHCKCKPGYTGKNCTVEIDSCIGHQCKNGALCQGHGHQYTCTCPPGFAGEFCQSDLDDCVSQPCLNGGVCTDAPNSYVCSCHHGFTGQRCEYELNGCLSSPCVHGTCYDTMENFACVCSDGWTGQKCDVIVSPCLSLPCENNGTCTSTTTQFTCACLPEFTGLTCGVRLSLCEPNPCKNGAVCSHDFDRVTCVCLQGYHGNHCENSMAECNETACQNGGSCIQEGLEIRCQCPHLYTGLYCEKEKSSNYDLVLSLESQTQCESSMISQGLNSFTLCVWVLGIPPGSTFLRLLNDSGHQIVSLSTELVTLTWAGDNKTHASVKISAESWHRLCLTWTSQTGSLEVYVDDTRTHSDTGYGTGKGLNRFKVVIGHPDSMTLFQGHITGVNMFSNNEAVHDLDLLTCNGNHGNILRWVEFGECVQGHVGHYNAPSACPKSTTGVIDKVPPVVEFCPDTIVKATEALRVPVTWTEPRFKDNIEVTEVKQTDHSGNQFGYGEYLVTYGAFDTNNMVMCSFKILVIPQHCKEPSPPINGFSDCQSVDAQRIYCRVSCSADKTFVDRVPEMYTCGPEGVWDPPRGREFTFPPCAGFRLADVHYAGSLTLTGSSCPGESTIEHLLRAQIEAGGLCSAAHCGADDISIQTLCVPSGKAKRSTEPVQIIVNFNITNQDLTGENQTVALDKFESSLKDMTSEYNLETVAMVTSYTCDQGQVLNDRNQCVNCSIGQYYDASKSECIACDKGTYTDTEKQTTCKPCAEEQTTLMEGATSASQCYKLCKAGHYDLDGFCEPCGEGTYQDETGARSCKPCGNGKTTSQTGSTSLNDCHTACAILGMILSPDGSCVPCPQGSYKDQALDTNCQPCPTNLTTLREGAKSSDECVSTEHCEESECTRTCVGTGQINTCQCPQGFTWVNGACVDSCEVICDHGDCVKDVNGISACKCHSGYTGLQCQEKSPTYSNVTVYAVGGSVFAAVILLAVVIFVLYKRYVEPWQRKENSRGLFTPITTRLQRSEIPSSFRAWAHRIHYHREQRSSDIALQHHGGAGTSAVSAGTRQGQGHWSEAETMSNTSARTKDTYF